MFRLFRKQRSNNRHIYENKTTDNSLVQETVEVSHTDVVFPDNVLNVASIKEDGTSMVSICDRKTQKEEEKSKAKEEKKHKKIQEENKRKLKNLKSKAKEDIQLEEKKTENETSEMANRREKKQLIKEKLDKFIVEDQANETEYENTILENQKKIIQKQSQDNSNNHTTGHQKLQADSTLEQNEVEEIRRHFENQQRIKSEITSDIFAVLQKFDGRQCNLMISNGKVLEYFDSSIFKVFDSTKWKLFYFNVAYSREEMSKFNIISENFYLTAPCKNFIYEMGPIKYLKMLELIDVCFIGDDITVPQSMKYCVIDNFQQILTDRFIRDCVDKTYVVCTNKKVKYEGFSYQIITYKSKTKIGFIKKVIKSIF